MPALIVGHACRHCKRPRNQLRWGPGSRVCYVDMHTCERSAVVPPLRWVRLVVPVFLFPIGSFHRVVSGAITRDLTPALEGPGVRAGEWAR